MVVQRTVSADAERQMQKFYFAKNVISSEPEWETTGNELLRLPSGLMLAGKAKQAWEEGDYQVSVALPPLHYFGSSVKTASGLVLWQLWTGVFSNTWKLLGPNDNTYKVTCRYTGTLRIAVSCTGSRGNVVFTGSQRWAAKGERGSYSLFRTGDEYELALLLMVHHLRIVLRFKLLCLSLLAVGSVSLVAANIGTLMRLTFG